MPKLCSELDLPNPNERHLTVGFQTISLTILEALTVPTSVRAVYRELHQHYANCRKIAPVRGLRISGTGKELSMTQIGRVSQAFAFALSVHGTHLNEDLVVFRTPFSCGVVEFLSESPLNLEQFEFVASIAAAKANSVVSVPTIATSAPSHSS